MSSRTILAAAVGVACVTIASRDAEASWCRYDDPAYVERQRHALDEPDPDKIPCPEMGDPARRPQQLVLPMPCGRRMVFRRVDFTLDHALDHKQAYLGSVAEETDSAYGNLSAVVNGHWSDTVAGGFADPEKGRLLRSYYIGKYEVTELQFQLLRDGLFGEVSERADDPACATYRDSMSRVSGTKVLPAVDMTWLDAVSFAFRYSAWLLALDQRRTSVGEPRYLPWEASAPGYLRLPSEVEWEYGARGGRVDRSDRGERAYHVADDDSVRLADIDEIAALATAQNQPPDGAAVFYVGRRLPNTLQLYDMVGNAAEMVYDLFQPTRPDTLGGQRGGFVLRGGSAGQSASRIGVGYRQESMFFDSDGPVRSPSTGFRLLMSVPMIMNQPGQMGNEELAAAIVAALGQITDASELSETAALASPRAEIENLRQEHAEQLEALRQKHAKDHQRLQDLQAQIRGLQHAEAHSRQLREMLAAERARIAEIEEDAQRERAVQREAYEQELAELEKTRAEQGRRIEALQGQLDDAAGAGEAEQMRALLAETQQTIRDLQITADERFERLQQEHVEERRLLNERLSGEASRIRDLESELAQLRSGAGGNLQVVLESTQEELAALQAERAANEARLTEMTAALAAARAGLDSSTSRLHERNQRIRREQLHSLVLMAVNIQNVQRRILASESVIRSLSANPAQRSTAQVRDVIAQSREVIANLRLFNRANFDYYIETVYALADAGPEVADAARRAVAADLETRGLTTLDDAQEEAFEHIEEAMRTGGAVPQSRLEIWFEEITAAN